MRHNKFLFLSTLILLSAVSLIWLIAHFIENFPVQGVFNMLDPDSMLFTRILEQSILKEKILTTDNYGCFPYEIQHGLPPFYLSFLYNVVNISFVFLANSNLDPMWVAGVLPILFTWLTALMIVLSVWFVSKNISLTLFCTLALLPGYAAQMNSAFLKLDYDFIISFFIWAWLLLSALFIIYPQKKFLYSGAFITSMFVAAWSGVPMFFLIVTLYGFVIWLLDRPMASSFNLYASFSMLVASIVNIGYILFYDPMSQIISINKYSFFQPLTCFAGGLFLYILYTFAKTSKKSSKLYAGLIFLCLVVLLCFIFQSQVWQSLSFILAIDPIHRTITELRSVYSMKSANFSPVKFFEDYFKVFGIHIFLFPFFLFIPVLGFKKNMGEFFKFWLTIFIVLAAIQIRYIRWPGIGLGMYAGILVYTLWVWTSHILQQDRFKNFKLVAIFLPLIVLSLSLNFNFISRSSILPDDTMEALNWINQKTPETKGYYDYEPPEYSVLSYWDVGNSINYYGKRPSVVNNAMWGYKTMADVFSALNEEEAFNLCQKMKIRYIWLDPTREFHRHIYDYWHVLRNMPDKPEYQLFWGEVEPVTYYKDYFFFWLKDKLGIVTYAGFEPAEHYRLVYVGNTHKHAKLYPYILFECVKGAKISLKIDPNTQLQISLTMTLDEKEFLYKKTLEADKDGKIQIIVPYSNNYLGGRVKTDLIYKISYDKDEQNVKAFAVVTEEDVINGNEVTAELLK